tara:strand:+ start:316 stop:963 length:648 start_codon:yes stop_codon:yes gene_type:complete
MAWPSGTKAVTTNVDAGADLISLARPDIKQNIDNVNSIIDHLNISSPSDGDVLKYSSSTGKWEQVGATTLGTQIAVIDVSCPNLNENATVLVGSAAALDIAQLTEAVDTGAIVSLTGDSGSAYEITLVAGKYMIALEAGDLTGANTFDLRLVDKTNDSGGGWEMRVTSSEQSNTFVNKYFDTAVYSTVLQVRFGYADNAVGDGSYTGQILITKLG